MGRFLSIDPLADAEGQQVLSPYHAMGCNPSTMTDPLGLAPKAGVIRMTMDDRLMTPYEGAYYTGGDHSFGYLVDASWAAIAIHNKWLDGLMEAGSYTVTGTEAIVAFTSIVANAAIGVNEITATNNANSNSNVVDFPEGGMYSIGNVTYDLNSFVKFYADNAKKFEARAIQIDNGEFYEKVSLEDVKSIKVNGKSAKLYSEVGSYLAMEEEGFGVTVRYRKNPFDVRSGTLFGFNFTNNSVYPRPLFYSSDLRIHLHPYGGEKFSISFTILNSARNTVIYDIPFPAGGPSNGDYKNTFGTSYNLRFVVVDQKYIYLYNKNPYETIKIRR